MDTWTATLRRATRARPRAASARAPDPHPRRRPGGGGLPGGLRATLVGAALAALLAPFAAERVLAEPDVTAHPRADRGYTFPLHEPVEVARVFDAPEERWRSGHRGVDLRAAPGGPVLAPAAGVVTFVGPVAGRVVLTLRHPDGRRSSVEPVAPGVTAGDVVDQGALLGHVGEETTHCAPTTCLHWGVRTPDDAYVDPLTLLAGRGPVVLLPDAP